VTKLQPGGNRKTKAKSRRARQGRQQAELSNDRLEKQAQKEEREKLAKVVFIKNATKRRW